MRLIAQTKLGFYPAHPDAVWAICNHLRAPDDPSNLNILDTCAGEGLALRIIAHHLGCHAENVFAIELDRGRTEKCRENLPKSRIVGPASFMGVRFSPASLSLVYCNPPFDDELGGGQRQELTFTQHAMRLLKTGGLLVLVVPETAVSWAFAQYIDEWFDDVSVYRFPEHVRPFKELCIFGRRRLKANTADKGDGPFYATFCRRDWTTVPELGSGHIYDVLPSVGPRVVSKSAITDEELAEAIAKSPLARHFKPPLDHTAKRPPTDLSKGHVATLLASGMLDGAIFPEGEPPHVVRGRSVKVDFQSQTPEMTTDEETKVTTVVERFSQRFDLNTRAIWPDGTILTFKQTPDDASNAVAGTQEGPNL